MSATKRAWWYMTYRGMSEAEAYEAVRAENEGSIEGGMPQSSGDACVASERYPSDLDSRLCFAPECSEDAA